MAKSGELPGFAWCSGNIVSPWLGEDFGFKSRSVHFFKMNQKIKNIIKKSKLKILPSEFIIAKLRKSDNAKLINELSKIKNFYSITNENKEISLLISKKDWNKIKNNFKNYKTESFKIFYFDVNLSWDLTGFIANIAKLLAQNNISTGVISTYNKDYFLIKKSKLNKALKIIKTLKNNFNIPK